MTNYEALLSAAHYIGADGASMDPDRADEVVSALGRIAADYFGSDMSFAAFQDILKRGGFKLVVEPIA